MKRVLVTGARSPAALELCRGLAADGVTVYAADTLFLPLASWSNSVKRYFRLPSPRFKREAFIRKLSQIIEKYEIDVVIPTCEEAFHLSAVKDQLPTRASYFVDDIATLDRLHNKFTVQQCLVPDSYLVGPETKLIEDIEKLRKLEMYDPLVFKRAYSRFAEGTFIKPSKAEIDEIKPTPNDPFVAQEFIDGDEYCIYAVAAHGVPKAVTVYRPKYRAGLGAGIYFDPVDDLAFEAAIWSFIIENKLHGQISFDVIQARYFGREGMYLIECNPRATSGIHLLGADAGFADLFGIETDREPRFRSTDTQKKMVALAMLSYGRRNTRNRFDFKTDFRRAKDVIWSRADKLPAIGQLLSMAELLWLASRRGISPLAATTYDIEWNGPNG